MLIPSSSALAQYRTLQTLSRMLGHNRGCPSGHTDEENQIDGLATDLRTGDVPIAEERTQKRIGRMTV